MSDTKNSPGNTGKENHSKPLINPCPTCQTPVEWKPENTFRPFCSQRCKLIDFGDWASEKNKLPVEEGPDNLSFKIEDDDQI